MGTISIVCQGWAQGRAPALGCSCALGLWALRATSGSSCSRRDLGPPLPFPRGCQRAPQASKPRRLQLWLLPGPARAGAGGGAAATQPQRGRSRAQQLPPVTVSLPVPVTVSLPVSVSVSVFVSSISSFPVSGAENDPLLPPGNASTFMGFCCIP